MKLDRFFASFKITVLLLALLAGQAAWGQNMTTVEITVSFQGMSNGSQYSYVIASGSHTYPSGIQSGEFASFNGTTSYDIGTQYGAYDLPLSMTLNGDISFVSETSSDAIVRNGNFSLTFTSTTKYILRAIVTTGAVADTVAGNRTSSLKRNSGT